MNFGWHTSVADSEAIMERALDEGVNFFDTADVYSGWADESEWGKSEALIGDWMQKDAARRDRVVLATKVYGGMPRKNAAEPNRDTAGLSALKIIRHCEDSLRRLRTDRIDLYQMHHEDRNCPWDEVWQAMETLTRQGKVVYVGSSNFAAWNLALCHQAGLDRNLVGLVSEQSHYNLRVRQIELEVVPACRALGIGLIPWSPLAGGYLGGALEKVDGGRRDNEGFVKTVEEIRPQREKYEGLAKELGHSPAELALAWLLSNDVVTAPIVGPRTMEQFTSSLPATEIALSDETLKTLDEIWPGPGGEAPKAYAW